MNVVGKVGSFISQGVYSVATPFHPFGGAVDVIVVQQQDGTFRSTPWYVRFGKFQGVLKGTEKIVRIAVNGVEADFHMYLDNSGEAYFIKEVTNAECSTEKVDLKEGIITETEPNDTNKDEKINLGMIERTTSDGARSFYDFQDGQSSIEDSVELSEYGSSRYSNLDVDEHYVESNNLNSEVVLVSVDGHILTAPISSLERNTDNTVQLSTPQFHLGPGQEADFCEDSAEFTTYLNVLDNSSDSKDRCFEEPAINEEHSCQVQENLNACEGERHSGTENNSKSVNTNNLTDRCFEEPAIVEEHYCKVQENLNACVTEKHSGTENNSESVSTDITKDDIFKSCLDIPALINHDMTSPLDSIEDEDTSVQPAKEDVDTDNRLSLCGDELVPSNYCPPNDVVSSNPSLENPSCSYVNLENSPQKKGDEENDNELIGESEVTGSMDSPNSIIQDTQVEEVVDDAFSVEQCSPQVSVDKSCGSEIMDSVKASSGDKTKTGSRFEISLCGNLLLPGMGITAAAEIFEEHRISEGDFKMSAAAIIKNENLIIRCQNKYLSWEKAAPVILGSATYGLDLPIHPSDAIAVEKYEESKFGDDEITELPSTPSGRRWRLWPIPFRRVKTLEHTSSNSSSDEVFVDSESISQNQPIETTPTSIAGNEHKQFLRINVPTNEQIASLSLNEGQNMVTFRFSTRVLGMQQVDAHIYLWKWNARIVISDVDGTITKSDVLGQFMPLVGRDWTQSGVARLFSAIKENGYQLLFLSARAIVQAYLTRSFLNNIKQDGKALPNGPVVISPDGLFPSLYREVIRRAPHEFKIACLEDIKALFPPDYNPFYAGFGNRDTDELSYRKIGIPKGKIFIINPKGEVAISKHLIDVKSYTSLHTLVNDMFPPTSMVEQEDFNSWNYWRMPLPDLD